MFNSSKQSDIRNGSLLDGVGPNVDAALEPAVHETSKTSQPRKCTIGQRKPASKVSSLRVACRVMASCVPKS